MRSIVIIVIVTLSLVGRVVAQPQDGVRYTGTTLANIDYHHGQLAPVVGVHNIQVLRANREHPEQADGMGWTYNHAPMLAYWNNTFYLEYLSDPVGEHMPPSQTLLITSADGYQWSKPVVVFPPYKVPDGTVKSGHPGVAKNLYAIMHQRMGFYVSSKKRLLALAYYGIALDAKDDPNDGNGIGRVVREVKADGSFGPIYFIRYNAAWNPKNTLYPAYASSKDKGFVEACNELLANPLMMQQWNEEADRNDPLVPIKKDYKAFCFYHLPEKGVVGLWKHALTATSQDGGKTWTTPARAPGFVNSNAKIWGQRTSDGRYATVYNPSEFRWPLALSTSEDGLNYTSLLLVHGEITPMRYGGNYKSYGPQYVRGIEEGNGTPPGGNLWVTYSMNKEDLWVASVPIPVREKAEQHIQDVFAEMKAGEELKQWNIYSPLWAPVKIERMADGTRALTLRDRDRYDYAKAERLFPAVKKLVASFTVIPAQHNAGPLHIEFQDAKGTAAVRVVANGDSTFTIKAGARFKNLMKYKAGEVYDFRIILDTTTRFCTVSINGKQIGTYLFFAPVESLSRIVFRTGEPRNFPTPETPADQTYDLPQAGDAAEAIGYYIKSLTTEEL